MLSLYLEALRCKAGLTCKQLAQECNVSESTISRVLSGETCDPSFHTIMHIVVACGGSLDELAGIRAVGETKSPLDAMKEEYEERISCIKAEHRERIRELQAGHDAQREESARREAALSQSGDKKVYFVIAVTAALMTVQGIIDVVLLSFLL